MAEFLCDNERVEKCLKKLETQIVAGGGWLHENLIVREEGGDLSLECSLPPDRRDKLIFIPDPLLLPLLEVEINLSGNDLCIEKVAPELTPQRREIFETVLELFNLTGKIKTHIKSYPWLALATDSATLNRLVTGRPDTNFISVFLREIKSANLNPLTMISFFKTRLLRVADDKKMLMPFIDCANHHSNAVGYLYARESKDGPNLSFDNSHSIPGSQESFVSYGNYDAFDLFINYGFVEPSSIFVRSVPMTVQLDGLGEISTRAVCRVGTKRELASDLSDLRFYLPEIISNQENVLTITHLMIPGPKASQALCRVLAELVTTLEPDLADADIFKFVKMAEGQVVGTNIKFYRDLQNFLKDKLAAAPENLALATAITMTDIQLSKLGSYKTL